jgi:hypothetical protein
MDGNGRATLGPGRGHCRNSGQGRKDIRRIGRPLATSRH